MYVRPITLQTAREFIDEYHRHNDPPRGHRFSIGLFGECNLFGDVEIQYGAVVLSRPVARQLDNGVTAEITRLCVIPHSPLGACSMLYRAAWRAWREMGGKKLVTYTLQSESGASLRGAGFIREVELKGNKGVAWQNRSGRKRQVVVGEDKIRWAIYANQS